jgi:hypothetical protein
LIGVAPILPSRDLSATAAFYARLGFEQTGLWEDDAECTALDLPVEGIPRLHGAPEDTDYRLREFALVDPDGNLLRIGSFIADPR